MTSRHVLTTVMATLAIASFAAFGCSKDKKKDKSDKADPKSKVTDNPGAARNTKAPSPAANALAMFPKDSNVYFGINGDKVRASELLKPYLGKLASQGGKNFSQLKDCGIDVTSTLKSMSGGMNVDTKKGIFAVKGITKAQLDECAKNSKGDDKIEVEHSGSITTVTQKGEKLVLRWLDDTSFLGGPKIAAADLEAAAAGKGGLDGNPEMMKLIGKVDTSAAVYFAMLPPARKQQTPLGKVNGAYASFSFDSGLKVRGGAVMPSPDEANAAVARANSHMEMVKATPLGKFASKVVLKADGANVTMQLSLTPEDVKELEQMIKNNPMIRMILDSGMDSSDGTSADPEP